MKDKNQKISESEFNEELEFDESEELGDQGTIKKLRNKLKEAETQKQEYLAGWQRDKADFINLRKQDEVRQKDVIKFAKEDLLLQIIPVLDSFDMALGNEKALADLPSTWVSGVKHIYNQFLAILLENGVKPLDPLGEDFDPKRDEALEMVAVDDKKDDHKVITVIQKGYQLHDRLLRPAKVKVGQYQN